MLAESGMKRNERNLSDVPQEVREVYRVRTCLSMNSTELSHNCSEAANPALST